ncbi:hypothetical protein Bbelb_407410 [Branchiostoma belcheri]|nr:hypothetical protein Bbelb_407410 [Branchiostoma belcheri]
MSFLGYCTRFAESTLAGTWAAVEVDAGKRKGHGLRTMVGMTSPARRRCPGAPEVRDPPADSDRRPHYPEEDLLKGNDYCEGLLRHPGLGHDNCTTTYDECERATRKGSSYPAIGAHTCQASFYFHRAVFPRLQSPPIPAILTAVMLVLFIPTISVKYRRLPISSLTTAIFAGTRSSEVKMNLGLCNVDTELFKFGEEGVCLTGLEASCAAGGWQDVTLNMSMYMYQARVCRKCLFVSSRNEMGSRQGKPKQISRQAMMLENASELRISKHRKETRI